MYYMYSFMLLFVILVRVKTHVPSSVDRSSTDEGQEQWGNNYRAAKTARESQFTQAYLCGNAWSGMDGQKEAITSIGTGCCLAYLKSNIISLLCKIVDITMAQSLLLGSLYFASLSVSKPLATGQGSLSQQQQIMQS